MITRTCPICNVPLEQEDYEGFPVLRCPDCSGHLVNRSRYEAIKRLPRKTLADLETEARDGFQGDNPETIRCPRCRFAMQKRPLPVPGFDLHMDLGRLCALAWFDGGELAMTQLGHQSTPAFRDRGEMSRRSESLHADPERKAAFDEALSKMPLEKDVFTQSLKESVADALLHVLFRSAFRVPFR